MRPDRQRGALLGTAVGDALGAPFEGHPEVSPQEIAAVLDGTAILTWTDDTHMALELAGALAASGGDVDPQALGDRFARAYREEPWRGYGAGPPRIFSMAERGVPYVEAAAVMFGGRGSYGNGAAMRAAPAGIVATPDLDRAARLAASQARVTHAHPEGIDGAMAIAVAVTALIATPPSAAPTATLRGILGHVATDVFRDRLRRVLDADGPAARRDVARRFGSGIAARESVPAALAAFLIGADTDPGSVTAVLVAAIGLGGDTDTVAAMAGALAGAHAGASAFPEALVARLEQRDRILQVAEELVALTPPA